MNAIGNLLARCDPEAVALVALDAGGHRTEHTFAAVAERSRVMAGALRARGVGRGDVVMMVLGSRPEWVWAMVACWRIGAVALPCTVMARPKDLALRAALAEPALVLTEQRYADVVAAAGLDPILVDDPGLRSDTAPGPDAELEAEDPALIVFTSGSSGEPKAVVHTQRYIAGQALQAEHWAGIRPGDLAWCTAAAGWSLSARNAFVAPWLQGATALLHDGRFDPVERLELLARERVTCLCMAPTEYRVIAKRVPSIPALPALRELASAGEALDPAVMDHWYRATGRWIRDGFGQTETGALTAITPGADARPGSMGRPLPGVRVQLDADGQLLVDPASVPTFFSRYLDRDRPDGWWPTGDRVRIDADGYLFHEGRVDDVIISSGYRIGPVEVEAALIAHPAVIEAAAVAHPDDERGAVVRAIVVLGDGAFPSDALARELQEHVKAQTAPYKYPRIVEFADELPRTATGKLRRAELRASRSGALG